VATPSIPTTIAAPDKNSSGVTVSNVKSSASASVANASSGVVTGQLSPTFAVADVPLRGPGTWTVATSAPAKVNLSCAGATIKVEGQLEIAANTTCQVTITPMGLNHSLTWELTPSA
jgi:glutamate dehydrogenase/leucine dehydrogenase